jgi:hypothetical protein
MLDPHAHNADTVATPKRRTIVGGLFALASSAFLPACGGGSTSGTSGAAVPPAPSAPTNPQPVPAGSMTTGSVTVTSGSSGTIGAGFNGLSYEKNTLAEPLFSPSNTNLIGLFKRIGPGVLRIGGNSVDRNVWTPNGAGQTSGQIAPSDVAALAGFVKAAGWQCLYGVNLGGAATGATTPTLAAAEVAYAASQLGPALLGIEIGNECDLYGDTGGYFVGHWSLEQFETLWEQYRSAILAATPGVSITGPASGGHESTWTVPFGETVTSSQISLLTQHYYRANGQSPSSTEAYLVSPDTALPSNLSMLQTGARAIGVPYRMSECNSFYNGGASGVSDSYASSLWVIDFLFACAQGGASGFNLHGGGDASGYTPIADHSGAVLGARPEYYGVLLFTLAGQGTLYPTSVSAGGLNVTAYAVKNASGGLSVVVVNKDETQNLRLTITLPQTATSAKLLAMTQLSSGASSPSLSATSGVTIQGAAVNPDGTFTPAAAYTPTVNGTQVACYVPALSAVLITTS